MIVLLCAHAPSVDPGWQVGAFAGRRRVSPRVQETELTRPLSPRVASAVEMDEPLPGGPQTLCLASGMVSGGVDLSRLAGRDALPAVFLMDPVAPVARVGFRACVVTENRAPGTRSR